MALELTEASYLSLGGDIYFTGPIGDDVDAGDPDGEPCAVVWVDRGKRQTRVAQLRRALSGTKSGITKVAVGRQGFITLEFEKLPYDLYALLKTSSNTDTRGTLHVVHQMGTEDLEVEWFGGLEWADQPHDYAGDPIPNFRIKLWCHGLADVEEEEP